jgi:hypothetical protein
LFFSRSWWSMMNASLPTRKGGDAQHSVSLAARFAVIAAGFEEVRIRSSFLVPRVVFRGDGVVLLEVLAVRPRVRPSGAPNWRRTAPTRTELRAGVDQHLRALDLSIQTVEECDVGSGHVQRVAPRGTSCPLPPLPQSSPGRRPRGRRTPRCAAGRSRCPCGSRSRLPYAPGEAGR